jgi:hypothetical protein
MIRDFVLFTEFDLETYQRIFDMKRELEKRGIEVTLERVIATAVEVAHENEWLQRLLEKEHE